MASTTYGFSVQAFLRILTLRLMDLLHTFPHLDLLIVLITLHLLPHCNLVCLLLSCLLLWDADLTHYLPQAPLAALYLSSHQGQQWDTLAGCCRECDGESEVKYFCSTLSPLWSADWM